MNREYQTPLSAALLDVLASVTTPMRADSLVKVLHVTGFVRSSGDPIPIEQITAALDEMIVAGQVEKVRRHGTAHYRATPLACAKETMSADGTQTAIVRR